MPWLEAEERRRRHGIRRWWYGLIALLASMILAASLATPAVNAATFTYDVATVARVDAREFEVADAGPAQLSELRQGSASQSLEGHGPSTTRVAPVVATNTADDLLPGLPSGAPKPLGLGSTGRVVPGDLTEQLAMTEVRSAPAGVQLPVTMADARWPAADGWVKMSQSVNGVEIHYVRNTVTGAVDDFKFIGGAG